MHEIELKFQVPKAQSAAVDRAVAGRAPQPCVRLQAAYCDTAQRALAKARLALRVRREGRQWVQTLKGATDDGMTRLEHNVAIAGTRMPPVNPSLHAGTPAGERLRAVLGELNGAAVVGDVSATGSAGEDGRHGSLGVRYRTDIHRRSRIQRNAQGRVELAFDTGSITAGTARLAVCELEIELHSGAPQAVIAAARSWVERFGLWLDMRSKSERGDMLARGEAMAPARLATTVQLESTLTTAQALRCVLTSCADQILTNASQIASGEHGDDHVHQLRVGLRRLRSALKLFADTPVDAALEPAAAELFRQLGAARDQVVIEASFAAELNAAMAAAGVAGELPPLGAGSAAVVPAELLRAPASQAMLLDLLGAMQEDVQHDPVDVSAMTEAADKSARRRSKHTSKRTAGSALRDLLARRLNRWHKGVVADAVRYRALGDDDRHRLRKRVKRLRYALEFSATLFASRKVRGYLKTLRAVQERLGAINDVVVAMDAYRNQRETDPRAWFALGWLAARRELLIDKALPDLKAFSRTQRFWQH